MKQEDKEKWITAFRESLEDYSEPPLFNDWERLEKELSVVPVAKPKRSYIMYYSAAAAIILLLIVSATAIYLFDNSSDKYFETSQLPAEIETITDKKPLKDVIKPLINDVNKNDRSALNKSAGKNSVLSGNKLALAKSTSANQPSALSGNKKDVVNTKAGKDAENSNDDETLSKNNASDLQRYNERKAIEEQKLNDNSGENKNVPQQGENNRSKKQGLKTSPRKAEHTTELWELPRKKKQKNLSIGVSAGNTLSYNSEGGGMDYAMSPSYDYLNCMNVEEAIASSLLKSTPVKWNHKQPVSFGLSVRKYLTQRLAIESGVVYTRLESESSGSKSHRQMLDYIGVPVKLNYMLVDKRYFTLYLSGGGMAEKCISGKLNTRELSGKDISEDVSVKPLQWSLNGALGAQYNITPKMGIFVEPGVVYFFDDGSKVETIRKETPFNFNLQLGLRISY
jgi:hypothetical protein